MIYPIIYEELVRVHQKDISKKVAPREKFNQATSRKFSKPGSIKRFIMVSFVTEQGDHMAEAREVFSG